MTISAGERVPSATLRFKTADGIQTVSTDELFKDRTVVVFGLPGAFTPTCSAKHLPGYVENAAALKAKGVDLIACVSVNDAHVMEAWGRDQKVGDAVMMLADGNAEFTKALGLETDSSDRGMGIRSRRYSMLVKNGVVERLNLEPPGAFEVSDAGTMLRQL